mmetsp:Transcript_124223/g.215362  ORF Transcript_124223/g.215362 Transcript_124223/m.215362 type:complete len:101 (+) Transcript_124223:226-528(+)
MLSSVQLSGGTGICFLVFVVMLYVKGANAAEHFARVFSDPVLLADGSAGSLSEEPSDLVQLCGRPPPALAKFIAVAGLGLVAGGALTVNSPLASALLAGL